MLAESGSIEMPRNGRMVALLRRTFQRFCGPLLQAWYWRYYSVGRLWRWRGLVIEIWPGVFAPGPSGSTAFTLDFLSEQPLGGKVVAEVGCGTGALSLQAARQGATVFAADINPLAVSNCRANAERNRLAVDARVGNLLEPFAGIGVEIVLVSPPFYPKDPGSLTEAAWYCGAGHSYFHQFFAQLAAPEFRHCQTLMNLSEDCDVSAILGIARGFGLGSNLVRARRLWGEWFYVFELRHVGMSG